jgi:hypothetical protein
MGVVPPPPVRLGPLFELAADRPSILVTNAIESEIRASTVKKGSRDLPENGMAPPDFNFAAGIFATGWMEIQ